MGRLTVCVAMCTYNGERFLAQQLESIASQSRKPDAMIVSDDGSSDSTPRMVESFARRAGFPVNLILNEQNLGFIGNFEQAIRACEGDIIVLSDQDDEWLPHRLEKIESAFLAAPGLGLVFSDAHLVDEDGRPLGARLWEAVGFTPREQRRFASGAGFEVLVRHNVVSGTTMALAARYRETALPIPDLRGVTGHDGWISLMIAAAAPVSIIAEPLVKYRQHGGNIIGARDASMVEKQQIALRNWREFYAIQLLLFEDAHARLSGLSSVPERNLRILSEKICHVKHRTSLRHVSRPRRVWPVLRELASGGYGRFSKGILSAGLDLVARG